MYKQQQKLEIFYQHYPFHAQSEKQYQDLVDFTIDLK